MLQLITKGKIDKSVNALYNKQKCVNAKRVIVLNLLKEVLTTSGAAKEWGKSSTTFRNACLSGRFNEDECCKSGSDWIMLRSAVIREFGQPPDRGEIKEGGILNMVLGFLGQFRPTREFPKDLAMLSKVTLDVKFIGDWSYSGKDHKIVIAPVSDYHKPFIVIVFARDYSSPMLNPHETFSAIITNLKQYDISLNECEVYLDFGLRFEESRRKKEIYGWNFDIQGDKLDDTFSQLKLDVLPEKIQEIFNCCYAELKPNYGMNINYIESMGDREWLIRKALHDVPEDYRDGFIKEVLSRDDNWHKKYMGMPAPDQR